MRRAGENALNSAGFLLIDDLFRPIYANPESVKILGYPNDVPNPAAVDGILTQKILSFLPRDFHRTHNSYVIQFQSGRRRYLCRAFVLENNWNGESAAAKIALLLERGLPGPPGDAGRQQNYGGTHEDPFGFAADPKYFHFSRANQEVLGSLMDVLREKKGVGVLIGQAGMGKSVLLNYLARKISDEFEILSIPAPLDSHDADLVRSVMALLGVEKPGSGIVENLRRLEAWLLAKYRTGKKVLLICDDAHRLNIESLESLCVLAGLQKSSQKLIQMLIAGRQELLQKMTDMQPESSLGRLANVFCRLAPMDEAEVCGYVLHRLRIAGCKKQVFTSGALSAVALYSRGVPLNVNMLCRHALSLAASGHLKLVDEKIVADSAYDLVLSAQPYPVPWLWDFADPEAKRAAGLARDRRGLRLVHKPSS